MNAYRVKWSGRDEGLNNPRDPYDHRKIRTTSNPGGGHITTIGGGGFEYVIVAESFDDAIGGLEGITSCEFLGPAIVARSA